MAIENFENKNIQDTFQRVVQTDGTNRLADGTGSFFIPVSSSHAITASHALFAVSASHEITFELSSSHAISADTASFATNFTASGNISASGTITALSMSGDGSNLTGIVSASHAGTANTALTATTATNGFSNALTVSTGLDLSGNAVNFNGSSARTLTLDLTEVITDDGANRILTSDGDGTLTAESAFLVNGGAVTLNGSLSASSFLQTATLRGDQNLSTGLQVDGYVLAQNITASGNISASEGTHNIGGNIIVGGAGNTNSITVQGTNGIIRGDTLSGSNINLLNDLRYGPSTNTKIGFISGNLINIDISGTTRLGITNTGINATGHIIASGDISASGTISGLDYTIDGRKFANGSSVDSNGIDLGNGGTGNLLLTHLTASGDISASGNLIVNNINGIIDGGTF